MRSVVTSVDIKYCDMLVVYFVRRRTSGLMKYYKENIYFPTPSSLARLVRVMSGGKVWAMPVETPEWDNFGMDENAICATCGSKLQVVRPGKYQCPECETTATLKAQEKAMKDAGLVFRQESE